MEKIAIKIGMSTSSLPFSLCTRAAMPASRAPVHGGAHDADAGAKLFVVLGVVCIVILTAAMVILS